MIGSTERISIRPAVGTWVVRIGGAVIAESSNALELFEADLPSVIFFPAGDVAMAFLDDNPTRSVCPFKGEARHYDVVAKSGVIEDAAYSYDKPTPECAEITDYVAFYTGKATVERL